MCRCCDSPSGWWKQPASGGGFLGEKLGGGDAEAPLGGWSELDPPAPQGWGFASKNHVQVLCDPRTAHRSLLKGCGGPMEKQRRPRCEKPAVRLQHAYKFLFTSEHVGEGSPCSPGAGVGQRDLNLDLRHCSLCLSTRPQGRHLHQRGLGPDLRDMSPRWACMGQSSTHI